MGDEGLSPLHRWRCRWDWCGAPRLSRREEDRGGGYNPERRRIISWTGFGAPGGVLRVGGSKEGFDRMTYIVKIDIYPAIVREYEVSDGVCPLYRLGVIVKGAQEPRIFGSDELA